MVASDRLCRERCAGAVRKYAGPGRCGRAYGRVHGGGLGLSVHVQDRLVWVERHENWAVFTVLPSLSGLRPLQ